jgi:hypothetical protein
MPGFRLRLAASMAAASFCAVPSFADAPSMPAWRAGEAWGKLRR